jgi:hypothetical protein
MQLFQWANFLFKWILCWFLRINFMFLNHMIMWISIRQLKDGTSLFASSFDKLICQLHIEFSHLFFVKNQSGTEVMKHVLNGSCFLLDYRFLESATRCIDNLARDKLKKLTRKGDGAMDLPPVISPIIQQSQSKQMHDTTKDCYKT